MTLVCIPHPSASVKMAAAVRMSACRRLALRLQMPARPLQTLFTRRALPVGPAQGVLHEQRTTDNSVPTHPAYHGGLAAGGRIAGRRGIRPGDWGCTPAAHAQEHGLHYHHCHARCVRRREHAGQSFRRQ